MFFKCKEKPKDKTVFLIGSSFDNYVHKGAFSSFDQATKFAKLLECYTITEVVIDRPELQPIVYEWNYVSQYWDKVSK